MSQYADENYYSDVFEGSAIPDDDIDTYLTMASLCIDDVTFGRIVDFNQLTEFQQEKIKEATCRQAEHLYENGEDADDELSSYTVLNISVTAKDEYSEHKANRFSRLAFLLLKQTGLMSRVL